MAKIVRVQMTEDQLNWFITMLKAKPPGMGMGDYQSWLADRVLPAEGFIQPYGPADAPVAISPTPPATVADVLQELKNQRDPRQPLLRALAISAGSNGNLDWSAQGRMTRLMIRNKGPNSAWIAFDQDGGSVNAATGDTSWELQAQEALSIELCDFQKVGAACSAGQTATIHAIAFPSNSGDFGGAVS